MTNIQRDVIIRCVRLVVSTIPSTHKPTTTTADSESNEKDIEEEDNESNQRKTTKRTMMFLTDQI